ncbi:MAG: ABC transporter permease [Acidobacteriota bacterium]|nr:ABC transporter permease [Acidobacteriota bacterium]
MIFGENFRIAFRALWANKMRSLLTTLGIVIGVAGVIGVVSIVQGLQHLLTKQFEGLGANFMIVQPRQQFGGPGMVQKPVRLTWDDGLAIRDAVAGIERITPQVFGAAQVKYRDRVHSSFAIGVNQDWPAVNNFAVDRGRFFNKLDLDRRQKVAVLGLDVVDELRLADPLGKEIYLGSVPVTVIGVMEEKGQTLGQNLDDLIFVPFDTALGVFGRSAAEQVQLRLRLEGTDDVDQVREEIRQLLRRRHRLADGDPDDFQIVVQDEILEQTNTLLGAVTLVVAVLVGISLVVGGIGIMNIMLVSVTERTREIGIRKSVGARRQDILVQFLIEAVTLSIVGGAIGLLLGYGAGRLATSLIPGDLPPAHVPLWAIVIAFGFSTVVGVFFGIYPAGKAARLDPIEALRYE